MKFVSTPHRRLLPLVVLSLLLLPAIPASAKDYTHRNFTDACEAGDYATVLKCIEAKLDVNRAGRMDNPPIVYAIHGGNHRIIRLLISKGADVNGTDNAHEKKSPLFAAAAEGDLKSIAILLEAGAEVNFLSAYRYTALMIAAKAGHTAAVKALLSAGAQVDLQFHLTMGPINDMGSALTEAARYGHPDAARALLEHGADVNLVNNRCHTAIFEAALYNHAAVADVLLEYGAIVNIVGTINHKSIWDGGGGEAFTAIEAALLPRRRKSDKPPTDEEKAAIQKAKTAREALSRKLATRGVLAEKSPDTHCEVKQPERPSGLTITGFAKETQSKYVRRISAYTDVLRRSIAALTREVHEIDAEQQQLELRNVTVRDRALKLWHERRRTFNEAETKIHSQIRKIQAERWVVPKELETTRLQYEAHLEELARLTRQVMDNRTAVSSMVLWKKRDEVLENLAQIGKLLPVKPAPKPARLAALRRELANLRHSDLRKRLDDASDEGFAESTKLVAKHRALARKAATKKHQLMERRLALAVIEAQRMSSKDAKDVLPALLGVSVRSEERDLFLVHGGLKEAHLDALKASVANFKVAHRRTEARLKGLVASETKSARARDWAYDRAETQHFELCWAVEELGDGLKDLAGLRAYAQISVSLSRVAAAGATGGGLYGALVEALSMAAYEVYSRAIAEDGPAGWKRYDQKPLYAHYGKLSRRLGLDAARLPDPSALKELKGAEELKKLLSSALTGALASEIAYLAVKREASGLDAGREVIARAFQGTDKQTAEAVGEFTEALNEAAARRVAGRSRSFTQLAVDRAKNALARIDAIGARRAAVSAELDLAEKALATARQKVVGSNWRRSLRKVGTGAAAGVLVSFAYDAIEAVLNSELQEEEKALWEAYFEASFNIRFALLDLVESSRIYVLRKNARVRAELQRDILASLQFHAKGMLARYELGEPEAPRTAHTARFEASAAPIVVVVDAWAATGGVEMVLKSARGQVALEARTSLPDLEQFDRMTQVLRHVRETKQKTTWKAIVTKEMLAELGRGELTLEVVFR